MNSLYKSNKSFQKVGFLGFKVNPINPINPKP